MARAIDNSGGGNGGSDNQNATGTLSPLMSIIALEFTYNGQFAYTLSHNGPAMQMEATLLQNGAPVLGAMPIMVFVGMPMSGKLKNWSASGNQLQLRNMDMMSSVNYAVEIGQ